MQHLHLLLSLELSRPSTSKGTSSWTVELPIALTRYLLLSSASSLWIQKRTLSWICSSAVITSSRKTSRSVAVALGSTSVVARLGTSIMTRIQWMMCSVRTLASTIDTSSCNKTRSFWLLTSGTRRLGPCKNRADRMLKTSCRPPRWALTGSKH